MISSEGVEIGWGPVINFNKRTPRRRNPAEEETTYLIDILLCVDRSVDNKNSTLKPPLEGSKGEMKLVAIDLENITQISSVRILIPEDLKSYDNRQSVGKSIREVLRQFENKVPLLDPIEGKYIKNLY